MAYEEYDYYNEPSTGSLKESLYDILHGLTNKKNLIETGESLKSALQLTPNVTESLGRGGVAQAIGTSGDLRDLRNTINSYLPKSVRNFTQAAEFLANPYATAIQQTAPTTEQTLDFVPRVTDKYEGYKQHETLGEYIAPALGYFGAKALKAGKDLPAGMSIIGPESKLWKDATEGISLENLAYKASKMEAKGVPAEEIKRETGMARGLDNQWRSEISDFWSNIKGDKPFGQLWQEKLSAAPDQTNLKVADVLEHPELFRHYPELAEIKIQPHSLSERARGSYNEDTKTITLREDLTPEEARKVLHHELTHTVQGIENWNRGGSPEAMEAWMKTEANKRMDAATKKLDEIDAQIKQRKANGEDFSDLLPERFKAMDEQNKGWEFGQQDPFKLYKELGGEAEARMVADRLGLTEAQLREFFPYAEGKYGLDINPDVAKIAGYEPGVINGPAKSVEPPKSKQDELGFHSALETAVLGIKQPKGTGEQFLKQLEKTPGVKIEELETTGLKKFLQDHKFVTKEEVEKYISQQRLQLENKILKEGTGEGNYEDYQLHGGDVYDDEEYISSLADDFHHDLKNDPDLFQAEKDALLERYPELYEGHDTNPYMDARLNQDVEDALWDQAKQQAHDMYYENPIRHYYDDFDYDIYGNDDMGYSIKDTNGNFTNIGGRNGLYDLSDVEAALREHHLEQGNLNFDEEGAAKYADYVLPGRHENYREVLTTLPANMDPNIIGSKQYRDALKNVSTDRSNNELGEMLRQAEREDYESGHFDEANILAHMRVNDRRINGKKTLMVEEIQSDWHQEGRKKGYTQPISEERKMEIRLEIDKIERARKELYKVRANQVINKEPTIDSIDGPLAYLERQEVELRNQLKGNIGVPDAPFKKNWHEMMVKQALDMAAKGDYDAIAFTTGKQQGERYNLAKHVDSLNLIPSTSDKDYILQGWKDGNSIIRKEVNKDELGDYVGKEVAEKLLASDLGHGVKELKGNDLSVGGQGMKGFYDKILPDYINKYTKKWGMGMKKGNLASNAIPSSEHVYEIAKEFGYTKQEFDKLPVAERIKVLDAAQPKGEEVHFVELSDAAKKDIKEKGQPLFAGLGAIAGADYMEGLDEQNKAGIFKDLMKSKKH